MKTTSLWLTLSLFASLPSPANAAESTAPVVKFAAPFGLARGPVVIDGDPVQWGGMHDHPACGRTGVNQRFV